MKREDYISWDEYFMGIAMLAARRSKDPNTQVGACIVSPENIIISTGYNGMPKGCSDDEYPWEREGEQTKYPYVVHAELNAVLNANGRDLRGSKLYVALFPCNECAKAIIQSGVKEVYYLSDKYADSMSTLASKRMLDSAGVRYTQLRPSIRELRLDFVPEEERGKYVDCSTKSGDTQTALAGYRLFFFCQREEWTYSGLSVPAKRFNRSVQRSDAYPGQSGDIWQGKCKC